MIVKLLNFNNSPTSFGEDCSLESSLGPDLELLNSADFDLLSSWLSFWSVSEGEKIITQ